MMNDMIWCKNANMGANICIGTKSSVGAKPRIEYDPTNFLRLRYDYANMFGLCLMIKIFIG